MRRGERLRVAEEGRVSTERPEEELGHQEGKNGGKGGRDVSGGKILTRNKECPLPSLGSALRTQIPRLEALQL